MSQKTIGISDLSIFVPDQEIKLHTILEVRSQQDKHWHRRLSRAIQVTGQKALRFPSLWEDTTTLAAQACRDMVGRLTPEERERVRYLTIGTETGVDMSKPASSYVLGLMEKAGMALPNTLTTFQVQHACAGGTLGLLSVSGLLQSAGLRGDKGLILTSDIARYDAPSTAEITQGAGATAILVEENPKLLEIDLPSLGLYSSDVDDFFRPLNSITAKVKGGYSVQCYNESFLGAFEDHCKRLGVDPVEELRSIDIFTLHVPYSLMPLTALHKLFDKYLGFDGPQTDAYLEERGFFASIAPTATIGNIYTGSLYLGLAFSLKERYEALGQDMVGKKVLLASYGSGNTMALFTGKVAEEAPKVVSGWNLDNILKTNQEAPFESYQYWLDNGKAEAGFMLNGTTEKVPTGRFYLEKVREDGYREYSFK
jgi:hydroxymethylglutaryl-CoA synthase